MSCHASSSECPHHTSPTAPQDAAEHRFGARQRSCSKIEQRCHSPAPSIRRRTGMDTTNSLQFMDMKDS
jgi:hypothetical protein